MDKKKKKKPKKKRVLSYREKVAELRLTFVLLEVYRNIGSWPMQAAARTKDSYLYQEVYNN